MYRVDQGQVTYCSTSISRMICGRRLAMSQCAVILVGFLLLSSCDAGRILMSPDPCTSHTLYFMIIGRELVQRGHEVYMIFTPKFVYPKSVDEAGIKVLTWNAKEPEIYDQFGETFKDLAQFSIENEPNAIEGFWDLQEQEISLCTNLLGDQVLFKKLKELNFDLAIGDGLPFWRCANVLFYKLDIPFATVTTQYDTWLFRSPGLPSFVPFPQAVSFTEQMTFIERIQNLWWVVRWAAYPDLNTMADRLVTEFAPERPVVSMVTLARQSVLWLINSHIVLEYPRPSLPNMIDIGGLTTKQPQPLPEDLDYIASQSPSGTILVSFGSLIGEIPAHICEKLLTSFGKLKQNVIWKYVGSPLENVPRNVHLVKWIPQNDLLGHNNTKLFITHSGNNGQFESLYNGVPMIGMPIFAEQYYNANKMQSRGYGLVVRMKTFTSDELVAAIHEVLHNPKYAENIQKGSRIFKSQPERPERIASYWIEHVIQYGGNHLRSHALDMPWYEYIMLDIFGSLLLIAVSVAWISWKVMVLLVTKVLFRKNIEKSKHD